MDTPPTPEVPLDPDAAEPDPAPERTVTSKLLLGGAMAVLVVVVASIGFSLVSSSDSGSGAASPEDAVQSLIDAVGTEDLVAFTDAFLPGERDAVAGQMWELIDELVRLDLLADDIDRSSIRGLDLELVDTEMTTTAVADDIVVVDVTGTLLVDVTWTELPVGPAIMSRPELFEFAPQDVPATPPTPVNFFVATVRHDGGWYASVGYSIAEQARLDSGLPVPDPSEAVEPRGRDTPEAVVDAAVAEIVGGGAIDIEALLALVNPGEVGALHRYAPLFLPDGPIDPAEEGVSFDIADLEYRAEVDGDRATVEFDRVTLTMSYEDPWMGLVTMRFGYADGCINVLETYGDAPSPTMDGFDDDGWTPPGYTLESDGSVTMCPDEFPDMGPLVGLLGITSSPSGVEMVRHEGLWYLSPIRSYTEPWLETLRSLDDGAGSDLIELMVNPYASFADDFGMTSTEGWYTDDDAGSESIEITTD
ncbi:MAG: hypothetical protein ACXIVQ_09660 [Acidimicrobiales bacterium]